MMASSYVQTSLSVEILFCVADSGVVRSGKAREVDGSSEGSV